MTEAQEPGGGRKHSTGTRDARPPGGTPPIPPALEKEMSIPLLKKDDRSFIIQAKTSLRVTVLEISNTLYFQCNLYGLTDWFDYVRRSRRCTQKLFSKLSWFLKHELCMLQKKMLNSLY